MKLQTSNGKSTVNKGTRELVDSDVFLQPWFLPRDVYVQIRRVLPNAHLSKMRYYFEDYGCLRCGVRDSLYGSNGFCEKCGVLIRGRVTRALKRRLRNVGEVGPELEILNALGNGMETAQELLHKLKPRTRRQESRA
jgi:hypothetical protein